VLCPALIIAENIWEDEVTPNSYEGSGASGNQPSGDNWQSHGAEQDATYTIKPGDTLWDLAFSFLGNPFDWQRIWEINPYIKNPDLIYPGDKLAIPGRTARSSGDAAPQNLIPSETLGALQGAEGVSPAVTEVDYPGDSEFLSSITRRNVLSAAQRATAPFLWTKKDAKGYIYPGDGRVEPPKKSAAYQPFSKITVALYPEARYVPGDTIAIYSSMKFVLFNGRTANLVKQTGRAVVTECVLRKMEALLIEVNDVITGNERVAHAKEAAAYTLDTLTAPESVISAEIFTRVEQTESPYPFQMCILNSGSTHGVAMGDVFAVYSSKNAQLSVIGMIVRTEEESSTLCMMYMRQNVVDTGDRAQLLRRAQFSQQETADENGVHSAGTKEPSVVQQE